MSDDENLSIYDEIEIEDMTFDEALQLYHYPCPCGDRFQIALDDLRDEQDIAVCPSCSLMIRVIFDLVRLAPQPLTIPRFVNGWLSFRGFRASVFPDANPISGRFTETTTFWKRSTSSYRCLDMPLG